MKQLSETDFETYIDDMRVRLEGVVEISREKPINYGYQFLLKHNGEKATLNIYNGKKGLNSVWTGAGSIHALVEGEQAQADNPSKADPKMSSKAAPKANFKGAHKSSSTQIFKAHDEQEHDDLRSGQWAGSDESGKGDFFGPLVVASAVVDTLTADRLAAIGVKDCKQLTDKKILELEDKIKNCVVDYSVLVLKPHYYNIRYEQVVAGGGKLNQLLGSGHVAALSQVLERQPDCKYAIIDQFTKSDINLRVLHEKFPGVEVTQHPRAEEDLAVAAASVLARAAFLRTMYELAESAGLPELPKGSGPQVTAVAKSIADKLGKEALRDYVKAHFVCYKKI